MDALPDFATVSIVWQIVGQRNVFGFPTSGSHVYHWESKEDCGNYAKVQISALSTGGQVGLQQTPWALVEKSETIYCISKWYPAIEVSILRVTSSEAICEAFSSHMEVPRSFSFFRTTTTTGVNYRDDIWFLSPVDALNAYVMVARP